MFQRVNFKRVNFKRVNFKRELRVAPWAKWIYSRMFEGGLNTLV